MAKRKRGIPEPTSTKKRSKGKGGLPHTHGDIDPEQDFKIKSILKETKTHYLISWEDDEVTGEKFGNTWEPKQNANQLAIDDWEKQKADKKKVPSYAARPSEPPTESPRKQISSHRAKRVINSSSSVEEPVSTNGNHEASQDLLEISESQPESPSRSAAPDHNTTKQTAATVELASPPSSYLAGEYQKIPPSQIASGQSTQSRISPEPFTTQQDVSQATSISEIAASPYTQAQRPLSSPLGIVQSATKIVPDSQVFREPIGTTSAEENTADLETVPEEPDTETPLRGQVASIPTNKHSESEPSSSNVLLEPNLHAADSSAEADNVIQDQGIENSTVLDFASQLPSHQEDRAPPPSLQRPSQGAATHIDLTNTQNHPSLLSKFTVTPPPRNTRVDPPNRALASEAWQSSSLLQTQLSGSHSDSRAAGVPTEQSSVQLTTSPITPVPSQPIVAPNLGGSAPSRPPSFSSPSIGRMNSSQRSTPSRSGSELRQQLSAMRARSRMEIDAQNAKIGLSATIERTTKPDLPTQPEIKPPVRPALASPFLFARDSARSPSAVPAEEPLPIITLEEMNTSGRYETLLPQAEAEHGEAYQNGQPAKESSVVSQTDSNLHQLGTHAVPIYFLGHQRDQYSAMIYFYKATLQQFLATRTPDEALIQEARHFVDRIRRITIHPDLDNAETYTQYDVQPFQQADWDARCSAKFRFLQDLFSQLQGSKLRIAIIAAPGRIMAILATFLEGIKVPYDRKGTKPASEDSNGGVRAVLLESSVDNREHEQSVDLVIAVDNSVEHDAERVRDLRRTGKTPFISLVVPRSVEHVERCLSTRLPASAYLRALISGIYQYRDEAGRSQGVETQRPSASLLVQYLKQDDHQEWPLPSLHDLKDFDSQTDSELGEQGAETSISRSTGEKRSRESDGIDSNGTMPKRSRAESPAVGTPPVTQHYEGDTTHISDSIKKLTQLGSLREDGPVLTPTQMQRLLSETRDRLDEQTKVLADLQFRCEEQRTKLLEVSAERDDAMGTAQQAVNRLAEESNKMSNLRMENSKLKEELQEANAKLLNHSDPERAEFEKLRLNLQQAEQDRGRAEKRLDQASKDVAYVRELYQNASNIAQSSTAQITELQSQLAISEAQATGEHAKLRQMGLDERTKKLENDNYRLKATVNEQQTALRFRDEEIARLKEASRGRMGTRGSSVPRSPKLGSRQTSPATAETRVHAMGLHPLRGEIFK